MHKHNIQLFFAFLLFVTPFSQEAMELKEYRLNIPVQHPVTLSSLIIGGLTTCASYLFLAAHNENRLKQLLNNKEQELIHYKKDVALIEGLLHSPWREHIKHQCKKLHYTNTDNVFYQMKPLIEISSLEALPITIKSSWFRSLTNLFSSTLAISEQHPKKETILRLKHIVEQHQEAAICLHRLIKEYQAYERLNNALASIYQAHKGSIACCAQNSHSAPNSTSASYSSMFQEILGHLTLECSSAGNYPYVTIGQELDTHITALEKALKHFIQEVSFDEPTGLATKAQELLAYLKFINVQLKATQAYRVQLEQYTQHKAQEEARENARIKAQAEATARLEEAHAQKILAQAHAQRVQQDEALKREQARLARAERQRIRKEHNLNWWWDWDDWFN